MPTHDRHSVLRDKAVWGVNFNHSPPSGADCKKGFVPVSSLHTFIVLKGKTFFFETGVTTRRFATVACKKQYLFNFRYGSHVVLSKLSGQ